MPTSALTRSVKVVSHLTTHIHVQLNTLQTCPKMCSYTNGYSHFTYGAKAEAARTSPGPGDFQHPEFRPQIGKDITFGGQFRPPGWSAKIKEIDRLSWELDDDDDRENRRKRVVRRFQAPLQRHATSKHDGARRRHRRPSSAPPSSRFRRACARGRRLDSSTTGGGQGKHSDANAPGGGGNTPCHTPRSIADVVKEAGRKRRAKAAAAAASKGARPQNTGGRGAVFGSSPQRPTDGRRTPGPTSYRPVTLDEASRSGKVVSIGGKSRRALFPPSPETPGPDWYAPEVIQGPTPPKRRPSTSLSISSADTPADPSASRVIFAPQVGTFGSSDRFPKDPYRRPGVGEYDLRAAERAAGGASTAATPTFGRKPSGAPYDPSLNRYLRADDLKTPSVHAYSPESAKGGGGNGGLGGTSMAPPAWSFGGKRSAPRPPDGPGPGRFRPPYNNDADPCCSSSSAAVTRFAAGREVMSGCVSGVPWVVVEERAARGDGDGGDAKLYLPERNRMGARAFMRSRPLPRPRRVEVSGCHVDLTRGR